MAFSNSVIPNDIYNIDILYYVVRRIISREQFLLRAMMKIGREFSTHFFQNNVGIRTISSFA